jgi:integration host factor subunit alpha
MTLTKADLTRQVYKQHSFLTYKEAAEAVETILRISKESLIGGSDLLLSGFGKFNIRDKRPRRGRNPQTGEELTLGARRVITFRASGILKDKINCS